jgi:integrase
MTPWTRRLVRVDHGLFSYTEPDGAMKYAVRLQHEKKTWRKFGFTTKTAARKWLNRRRGNIANGEPLPEQEAAELPKPEPTMPLFADYAKGWLAASEAKGLKRSTMKDYRWIVDVRLIPAFESLPLDAVTRDHARELVVTLKAAGNAPKTIKNVLVALSAIYEQAIEDGKPVQNPARKPGKLLKIPKQTKVEVFTAAEVEVVLNAFKTKQPHYYPFVLTLFRTGMREGEACALQPEDLDLMSRHALVQRNLASGVFLEPSPKSGKARSVDLAADLVPVLKDHLALREAEAALTGKLPSPWLFTTPDSDMIRSNNFRDRVWRPLLKAIGLRYRKVHAIRHTYATLMILGKANLVYVQHQLGHSSIKITVDLYTHWIEAAERGDVLEVDRLSRVPSGEAVTQAVTQEK